MRVVVLGVLALTAWLCVCASQQGCLPQWSAEIDEGLRVSIYWPVQPGLPGVQPIIPLSTQTVRLTVTHEPVAVGSLTVRVEQVSTPDFAPIVVDVPRPIGGGGVTERVNVAVSAGAERVVRAEAFSAAGALLGSDVARGVIVRPGGVTLVELELLTDGSLDIVVR